MTTFAWIGVGVLALLVIYAAFVVALLLVGRRTDARALAGFIPDCLVLVRRLVADPEVPRRHKLLLGGLLVYLATPIDLVPDFIPVAGQADDALVAAFVLRSVLRASGSERVAAYWPGPESSLRLLLRLVDAP